MPIQFLERAAVELAGRHVAGHRQKRHRVEKRIAERDRQVRRTRPAGGEGRGRPPRDAVIDVGHEAGDALVMHRDGLELVGTLVQRVDELDIAVTAQAEHLRHFFLDQIVDDNLGPIERIARRHRITPYRFDSFRRSALTLLAADTAQARGTLFPIMLYVNLYCRRVDPTTALWRLNPVRPRTKEKASEKPASPRKTAIAKLVPSAPHDIDDDADDRQRVGVQSLGRAFAILEEVARHREGIGLAELSKLVGLHNSTTFHLAKTMVSLGYIRQEKDSKRYRVGRPLFALAASALDEIEMVNVATPVLEDLSRETSESGHFAVRMGDAVVVIARTSGPGAFQLTDRVGVVRPAHCTALGKIILASLRPDQLKRFLERVEMKPATKKSITEVSVLLREIAEIKRTGIAFDDGEFNPEVRCIAVPVMDFTGQVIGALGISGPIWRLSNQALQTHARVVRLAANRLSAEFGAKSVIKSS